MSKVNPNSPDLDIVRFPAVFKPFMFFKYGMCEILMKLSGDISLALNTNKISKDQKICNLIFKNCVSIKCSRIVTLSPFLLVCNYLLTLDMLIKLTYVRVHIYISQN